MSPWESTCVHGDSNLKYCLTRCKISNPCFYNIYQHWGSWGYKLLYCAVPSFNILHAFVDSDIMLLPKSIWQSTNWSVFSSGGKISHLRWLRRFSPSLQVCFFLYQTGASDQFATGSMLFQQSWNHLCQWLCEGLPVTSPITAKCRSAHQQEWTQPLLKVPHQCSIGSDEVLKPQNYFISECLGWL